MSEKINWGILSTAKIAVQKVIPAMQACQHANIVAIASRDESKVKQVVKSLNIPRVYNSYEELIGDDAIDAIYNPLPNHLHVPYTMRCIEQGKHVLCEKPIALSTNDIKALIEARNKHQVKVGEAFMVRTHPQWLTVLKMINDGLIGKLEAIHGFFSYYNRDPANIRNKLEFGGGALLDIGCYPIHVARFIFGEEPEKVVSMIDHDPDWNVDRLTSAMLKFPSGQATFTVGTQIVPYQTVQFFGSKKKLELQIPFNAPADAACKIYISEGNISLPYEKISTVEVCNQYTIQGDAFSLSILNDLTEPVPLEDALKNMAVIEAVFKSAESGQWEKPLL